MWALIMAKFDQCFCQDEALKLVLNLQDIKKGRSTELALARVDGLLNNDCISSIAAGTVRGALKGKITAMGIQNSVDSVVSSAFRKCKKRRK